jgi:adenylate cyclase
MLKSVSLYLPQDRLRALATQTPLADPAQGAALFADISGFTPLTEQLTQQLGTRRGIEELTLRINSVYQALIEAVEHWGGSVINFAGDAITCWFDGSDAPARATVCAQAMQTAMAAFEGLALKVAVTSGSVRRFAVGDPSIQLIDTLAGATVARLASGEGLASRGEVLLDEATVTMLGTALQITEWRTAETGERFALLESVTLSPVPVTPVDLPDISAETVQTWLLPAVYAREAGGFGAFLTELRPTVAMFLRFDGIDYDRDEAAGEKLDAVIRRAQQSISRYDGALLQVTIGDKGSYLYGAFGAPMAHEDDAARALQAARELQELPQTLPFLRPVQIGVSSGTTRAGAYGGETRRTYGVLGDDVNVAARLMTNAEPGEILVSSSVQKAASALFTFEPRLPLRVKGKRDLLTVFTLTGLRRQRAIRVEEPAYSLPMIGRQQELSVIDGVFQRALSGQGQVIGITAEAGLGKSRLVAEAIRLARQYGFSGYGGACESSGTKTPYLVWKGVWQAFFEIDPAADPQSQLQALERAVRARAPERADTLPVLAPLLDVPLEDNEFTRTLSPGERRNLLTILLESCLASAAAENPLLLVLEDLHWIDTLSYELLGALAQASAGLPVVFLLAYRPTETGALEARQLETLPQFTHISLQPLNNADGEQLLRVKLAQLFPDASDAMPDTLMKALLERAEGNPFYLEELLNYLRDQGINVYDPKTLGSLELPTSLYALILSRIDQLSEVQKAALKAASIIGRLFRAAWLYGYYPLLGDVGRVKDELDALSQLELTPLDTPEPELSYLFKHIVTREVTYESLPYETRTRLHEQLAQFIEGQGADSYLDLLAYHYGLTENRDKQREYFPKAGDAARAAFANDAAIDYYARVLPLLDNPSEQIDIHIRRGEVLDLIGRWQESEIEYQTALRLAEPDTIEAARAQFLLGRTANSHSNYPAALEWQEKARAIYARLNNSLGLAHVLLETGNINMSLGNMEAARQQLEEARTLGQQNGDSLTAGRALIELGKVAYLQGELSVARALFEESLAVMRTLGHKQGQAISLNALGVVAGELGDRMAQGSYLQDALTLTQQMGDRMGTAYILLNLGTLSTTRGDYDIARDQIMTSLPMFEAMGEQATYSLGLFYLGSVELMADNSAEARRLASESLAILRELKNNTNIVLVLLQLEWVAALLEGDLSGAKGALDEGLALAREMDNATLVAMGMVGLGHIALVQGDSEAARERFSASLTEIQGKDTSLSIIPAALLGVMAVTAEQKAFGQAIRLAAFSEGLRDSKVYSWTPLDRRVYERAIASARAGMSEADFNAARAAGTALTAEEAIALALDTGI